jgi:hypothetical protein
VSSTASAKSIEGDDMDVTSDAFSAFQRDTLAISSTPLDAACTEMSKKVREIRLTRSNDARAA